MKKNNSIVLRQVVVIYIIFVILLTMLITNKDRFVEIFASSALLISLSELLLPYIRKNIYEINFIIRDLLYVFPLFFPEIIDNSYKKIFILNIQIPHHKEDLLFWMLLIYFCLFSFNIKQIIKSFDSFESYVQRPKSLVMYDLLKILITILGEEFFYRLNLFQNQNAKITFSIVSLSSIVFALVHLSNRWFNLTSSFSDVIKLIVFNVALCYIYVCVNNIYITIILHIFYDISEFIILFRQLFKRKYSYFDDY